MKKALFVYDYDRNGLSGFTCALEVPLSKTDTYKDAIEFLHPALSSKEFVENLVREDCLDTDRFNESPYGFVYCGYRNYSLEYEFQYVGGDPDYAGEETIVVVKSIFFIDLV